MQPADPARARPIQAQRWRPRWRQTWGQNLAGLCCLLSLALLLAVGLPTAQAAPEGSSSAQDNADFAPNSGRWLQGKDFQGAWQYRWGDSPRDPQGRFIWSLPGSDEGWLPTAQPGNPPGRQGQQFLWLRVPVQTSTAIESILMLEIVDQLCEVFLDGQLIYRFGQLDGSGRWARRFLGYPVHYLPLTPLGGAQAGRPGILSLRIYSEHINIGVFGQQRIGSRLRLVSDLFRRDLSLLVSGILLFAVGLASLALFAYQRRDFAYLSYGCFALFVGLYALCRMKSVFWVDEHPLLSFHLELIAFYSCIPALLFFLNHVVGAGPLRLMPVLAWLTVAYDGLAFIAVALGWLPILKTLLPFQLLMLLGVLYTLTTISVALVRGSREARIFGLGFLLAALFSAYDTLAAIGFLPRVRTSFAHFGHSSFVLSLGMILLLRFQRVYSELLATKRDLSDKLAALQARTTEIEQLNEELRHQIEARSRSMVDSLLDRSSSSQEAVPILSIDSVLNQRYRVRKILGQGAMGVVYEVLRISDNRRLAAKVLSGSTGRQSLARFAREAQLLARLNHPHLVRIVDVDLIDNRMAYLVMDLVEGGTLAQRHARFGQLSFAMPVIRQIASALAQVHAAGIVHRDLKPANILLMPGSEIDVKLADFGVSALLPGDADREKQGTATATPDMDLALYNVTLDDPAQRPSAAARAAANEPALPVVPVGTLVETLDGRAHPSSSGGLTQTGVIIGTPLYMAPELAHGAKLARPASDMFSLGVVAYELLTGELPSEVPPIALNLKSGQRWYTSLAIRCPDLPGPIGDAIERCMDSAPERRPTAQALFDLLSVDP